MPDSKSAVFTSVVSDVGTVRVTYHLHVTFTVANIDKNNTAVVTTTIHPAAQANGLAQQGFGHKTAIVGTHGHRTAFKARL